MLRNETNFVGVCIDGVNAGVNNIWEGNKIPVVDGRTYVIRLYVHNNNLNEEESMAEDTQVRFYVSYASSDEVTVNG